MITTSILRRIASTLVVSYFLTAIGIGVFSLILLDLRGELYKFLLADLAGAITIFALMFVNLRLQRLASDVGVNTHELLRLSIWMSVGAVLSAQRFLGDPEIGTTTDILISISAWTGTGLLAGLVGMHLSKIGSVNFEENEVTQ